MHTTYQNQSDVPKRGPGTYINTLEFISCRHHSSTLLIVFRIILFPTVPIFYFLWNPRHPNLSINSSTKVMGFRLSKNIKKLVAGISKSCPLATTFAPYDAFRFPDGAPRHGYNKIVSACAGVEIDTPSLGTLGRLPIELRLEVYDLLAREITIPLNDFDLLDGITNFRSAEPRALSLVSRELHEEFKVAQEKNAWPTILCCFVKWERDVIAQ